MKISILLPYKENFSPTYAGAVSLNINETLKISKYRKNTTVFGNTEYRNKFKHCDEILHIKIWFSIALVR